MSNKLEYYTSLEEMPIYNWFKLQESNDLKYLLVKTRKVKESEVNELETGLQSLRKEYIETFGISDEYRRILELNRDIAVLKIDLLLTGDRSLLTMIEIKQVELKDAMNTGPKSDLFKVKVHVDKYMGYSVNPKETSVKEFYSILNALNEEMKAQVSHE